MRIDDPYVLICLGVIPVDKQRQSGLYSELNAELRACGWNAGPDAFRDAAPAMIAGLCCHGREAALLAGLALRLIFAVFVRVDGTSSGLTRVLAAWSRHRNYNVDAFARLADVPEADRDTPVFIAALIESGITAVMLNDSLMGSPGLITDLWGNLKELTGGTAASDELKKKALTAAIKTGVTLIPDSVAAFKTFYPALTG